LYIAAELWNYPEEEVPWPGQDNWDISNSYTYRIHYSSPFIHTISCTHTTFTPINTTLDYSSPRFTIFQEDSMTWGAGGIDNKMEVCPLSSEVHPSAHHSTTPPCMHHLPSLHAHIYSVHPLERSLTWSLLSGISIHPTLYPPPHLR
jgi:hypothetical protein